MLITDKEIALSKFEGLPAINPYFNNDYITHIEDCLEQTIGKIKLNNDNLKVYRIYAAAAMERSGVGIEINPVGWLYGFVKLKPALKVNVIKRIKKISAVANSIEQQLDVLPEFFNFCYRF